MTQGREDASPPGGRFVGAPHSGDVAHELPVRIYYEDTDFSGVVYHARYLMFLERGRTEFLRSAGVHHHELLAQDDPLVFALHSLAITYHAPARIDDAALVRTRFFQARGARLLIEQEMTRNGERLASADVVGVCVTPQGRPRRLSPAIIAAVTPFLSRKQA